MTSTLCWLLFGLSISHAMRYRCDRELTTCGCGFRDVDNRARIINGEEARPYSWSSIVSLRFGHPERHHCGGSILSDWFILTAAHCVDSSKISGPEDLYVHAGIHYLQEKAAVVRRVSKISVHPNWSSSIRPISPHDVAVVQLSEPLGLATNPYLSRACLPELPPTVNPADYPANLTQVMLAGWGATNYTVGKPPQVLQQVTFRHIHHDDPNCGTFITDPQKQVCAHTLLGDKRELHSFVKGIVYGALSFYFSWMFG
jgi:hypothetical protein